MNRFATVLAIALVSAGAAFADYELVRDDLQTYLEQEGIEYDVSMATDEQLAAIQSVMDSENETEIRGEVTAILEIPEE